MEFRDDGLVTVETPPQFPTYTAADFGTSAPYQYLCENFSGSSAALQLATVRMIENAKTVGFSVTNFRAILKSHLNEHRSAVRRGEVDNTTSFREQPMELDCGEWECWDTGIFRTNPNGFREMACAHPVMPVERLRNIDTDEVLCKLAFRRSKQKDWRTVVVAMKTISSSRTIVDLAAKDISVTSSTASALVDYLNDVCNRNIDIIPETKSISRMGYIPGEGFIPYVDGVAFDGDSSFRGLFDSIDQKGTLDAWCNAMTEIRKGSTEARIVLAASFASPVLSVVGSLPFFVHLWGGTGTGKTIALMAAASVWGNPALGSYVQTFNATGVSQERTAAFLNHLPFCIDELQLTRDAKGKITFDVYQLAQGVGRARGRRDGGIDAAPTWRCCFITTGESPIVSGSAGAGAVNRVIDIECSAEKKIVEDGKGLYSKLTQNYGLVGQSFVSKLYKSEEVQKQVREIYNDYYHELCKGDSTEKQAMAAAVILTGDFLATHWIFEDDGLELTVDDMRHFMATKESVSAGHRAYTWLRDWVASSANHFITDQRPASGDVYGTLEGNTAYIIRSVFDRVLQENGYSEKAVLSYLREKNLIETHTKGGKPNGYTKTKYIGGTKPQCVCLRLEGADTGYYCEEVDMLPL